MKHNIVVHIGGSKCGSSAIQNFLLQNIKELKTRNFYVPSLNLLEKSATTGEQIWYFQNMLDDKVQHRTRFRNRIDKFFDDKVEQTTLLLSAENLSNPFGFEEIFQGLEKKYNLKIIFYIRRQDDYLMSAWQQWNLKTSPDFWSWCIGQVGKKANWREAIEPWVNAFGKDACFVRIFEREMMDGNDINVDFCNLIGTDTKGLDITAGTINPSYNQAVEKFAESANFLFKDLHDNKVYEMIGELTGNRHYKRPEEVPLSRSQRISILTCYKESNDWIKQMFFPEVKRAELFTHVRATSFQHPSKTLEQEKDALIFDLIYQIYRRQKEQ